MDIHYTQHYNNKRNFILKRKMANYMFDNYNTRMSIFTCDSSLATLATLGFVQPTLISSVISALLNI